MNWRRSGVALGLLGLVLVIVLSAPWLRSEEPAYQGKPISYWLQQVSQLERIKDSTEAIQQIGEAGLPWILGELGAKDSRLKLKVEHYLSYQRVIALDFGRAEERRMRGVLAIRMLGPGAKAAIPRLGEMIKDRELALEAGEALGWIGKDAAPTLAEALGSRQIPTTRLAALAGLSEMGTNAVPATAALLEASHDPDLRIRRRSVQVLGVAEGDHPDMVLPVLKESLHAQDPTLRLFAVSMISSVWTNRAELQAVLVDGLTDANPQVRGMCAMGLGRMGEQARSAAPQLVEMLKDPENGLSVAAALRDILGAGCVAPIAQALTNQPARVQARWMLLISRFDTNAEPAVPMVVEHLKDADEFARSAAIVTLGRIHRRPDLTVEPLMEVLTNEDAGTRHAAAGALAAYGGDARAAGGLLLELAQQERAGTNDGAAAGSNWMMNLAVRVRRGDGGFGAPLARRDGRFGGGSGRRPFDDSFRPMGFAEALRQIDPELAAKAEQP